MMAGQRKTLPLAELVEDVTIYPRHAVDESHVAHLVEALKVGATLPPPVIDAASRRIVDGWHRVRAYRRQLGATGVILVELRSYAEEAALLQDAVALNALHGRRLDRIDQARVVLLLGRAGVSDARISALLQVPETRLERLRIRVATALGSGDATVPGTAMIVLKRGMAHLAGQALTAEQAAAHGSQAGTSYALQVRQLTDALRYELVDSADARLLAALRTLQQELGRYLAAHAEAA